MKREHTACEFKMDPSLPVLLVAERADSYGFYLCKAQHLSEQDKQRFSDDWKERILHPVSEEVELKHMHCEDFYSVVQTSQYEGAFLGCSNRYIQSARNSGTSCWLLTPGEAWSAPKRRSRKRLNLFVFKSNRRNTRCRMADYPTETELEDCGSNTTTPTTKAEKGLSPISSSRKSTCPFVAG